MIRKLTTVAMENPVPVPVMFANCDSECLMALESRVRELETKVAAADKPKAFKKNAAAKKLGVSPWTVWKLLSTGKLKQTPYGTIPETEIDRHLAEAAK